MFTTPTGQTGRDAYKYEAQQIANLLRELDARATRLAKAMADENPDGLPCPSRLGETMVIADYDLAGIARDGFVSRADDMEYVLGLLAATKDKPYGFSMGTQR